MSTGVLQFGARHVTVRGDGMWMQPEPLLYLGMTSGDTSLPRAYSATYAMGNTNTWMDRDGYFTVGADGTVSLNDADAAALNALAERSQQTGLESGAPIWQVTDASGAPTGEYVIGSPVDGTKDGYESVAAAGTPTGKSQLESSKSSAAAVAGVPEGQLKPAGLAHTHVDHVAGTPSVGVGSDVANLVGSAKNAASSDQRTFMITVAAHPSAGTRNMSTMSASNSSRTFSSLRDAAGMSRIKANYPSHERAAAALHSDLSYQAFELGADAVAPK